MSVVYRILDANVNRAKEAIRVLEEFYRFVENNQHATRKCKTLRHHLSQIVQEAGIFEKLLLNRDVEHDTIAGDYTASEASRTTFHDVRVANFQRLKEAMRVLEEYSKLVDDALGKAFQSMRFEVYQWETDLLRREKNDTNHRSKKR